MHGDRSVLLCVVCLCLTFVYSVSEIVLNVLNPVRKNILLYRVSLLLEATNYCL